MGLILLSSCKSLYSKLYCFQQRNLEKCLFSLIDKLECVEVDKHDRKGKNVKQFNV